MTWQTLVLGNTVTGEALVLVPLRRFTRAVVSTQVPGANPPGISVGGVVGVNVGVNVGVDVGVRVGVDVEVDVDVRVGVDVGVSVGVNDGIVVAVLVAVAVGVARGRSPIANGESEPTTPQMIPLATSLLDVTTTQSPPSKCSRSIWVGSTNQSG